MTAPTVDPRPYDWATDEDCWHTLHQPGCGYDTGGCTCPDPGPDHCTTCTGDPQ